MNTAERALAVQSVLEKYRNTTFAWGERDCLKMTRSLLVKYGAKGLPKMPRYRSELTAIRRMKEAGYDCLEDVLSELCTEIPTSWGMVGDIGVIKGEGAIPAIVVCAGPSWLGWSADHPVFANMDLKPERVFRYV